MHPAGSVQCKPGQQLLTVEQAFRRHQISRIEPFAKLFVNGLQNLSGTALIALPDP